MTSEAQADNPRAAIGGNAPPTTIDDAWAVYRDVSAFLEQMPVIQSDEDAKSAKGFFDRAKVVLTEMEIARDSKVRPLNETVAGINVEFKAASAPLGKLRDEVAARLRVFTLAEEARRAAALEEARRIQREAERVAREAEAAEAEARENAAHGEFTDAGTAIAVADDAFTDYQAASRAAALAAREAKVKVTGGTGRAFALRTKETLTITDPVAGLTAIIAGAGGTLPDKIADALLSAARNYRTLMGSLPKGFGVSHDR